MRLQPQGLVRSQCHMALVEEGTCSMRAPHRRVTGPSQSCEVVIIIVISIDIKIPIGQMRNLGCDLHRVTQPVGDDAGIQSLCPVPHCLLFHPGP